MIRLTVSGQTYTVTMFTVIEQLGVKMVVTSLGTWPLSSITSIDIA